MSVRLRPFPMFCRARRPMPALVDSDRWPNGGNGRDSGRRGAVRKAWYLPETVPGCRRTIAKRRACSSSPPTKGMPRRSSLSRRSTRRGGAVCKRTNARALDDLAPAIRRRRRPWKRQSLHAVVSLSNLRQSDLDRRAADRDAINPVADVGLRGGTVCGKLADGFSDERFERAPSETSSCARGRSSASFSRDTGAPPTNRSRSGASPAGQ